MYEASETSFMSCSVNEICGLTNATVDSLKSKLTAGINLCVTNGQQKKIEPILKEAGFTELVAYTNRRYHHNSKCKLWIATIESAKAVILLEKKKRKKNAKKKI